MGNPKIVTSDKDVSCLDCGRVTRLFFYCGVCSTTVCLKCSGGCLRLTELSVCKHCWRLASESQKEHYLELYSRRKKF